MLEGSPTTDVSPTHCRHLRLSLAHLHFWLFDFVACLSVVLEGRVRIVSAFLDKGTSLAISGGSLLRVGAYIVRVEGLS